MNSMFLPSLLFYYGLFLIICGITAVALIGMKAKTALVSGGIAGTLAITIGHFISQGSGVAKVGGVVLCLALSIVFCWRSTKTLFAIFEMITARTEGLKPKGIAFMIITFMAVVTIVMLLMKLSILSEGFK